MKKTNFNGYFLFDEFIEGDQRVSTLFYAYDEAELQACIVNEYCDTQLDSICNTPFSELMKGIELEFKNESGSIATVTISLYCKDNLDLLFNKLESYSFEDNETPIDFSKSLKAANSDIDIRKVVEEINIYNRKHDHV